MAIDHRNRVSSLSTPNTAGFAHPEIPPVLHLALLAHQGRRPYTVSERPPPTNTLPLATVGTENLTATPA